MWLCFECGPCLHMPFGLEQLSKGSYIPCQWHHLNMSNQNGSSANLDVKVHKLMDS